MFGVDINNVWQKGDGHTDRVNTHFATKRKCLILNKFRPPPGCGHSCPCCVHCCAGWADRTGSPRPPPPPPPPPPPLQWCCTEPPPGKHFSSEKHDSSSFFVEKMKNKCVFLWCWSLCVVVTPVWCWRPHSWCREEGGCCCRLAGRISGPAVTGREGSGPWRTRCRAEGPEVSAGGPGWCVSGFRHSWAAVAPSAGWNSLRRVRRTVRRIWRSDTSSPPWKTWRTTGWGSWQSRTCRGASWWPGGCRTPGWAGPRTSGSESGSVWANIQPSWSYLEASLVSVGNDVLSTVGEAVTGQAERHAEPPILVLEVLVSRTLVLCPLPAGLPSPHQLVAGEDQVDLGLNIPVPQRDLNQAGVTRYSFLPISPPTLTVIEAGLSKVDNILSGLERYTIFSIKN